MAAVFQCAIFCLYTNSRDMREASSHFQFGQIRCLRDLFKRFPTSSLSGRFWLNFYRSPLLTLQTVNFPNGQPGSWPRWLCNNGAAVAISCGPGLIKQWRRRQLDDGIVAQRGDGFQAHGSTALNRFHWGICRRISAPLDLGIAAFKRIDRTDYQPMILGEALEARTRPPSRP
jgi:hypothetical protein